MSVQYRSNPSEVLQSSTIMMRRHLLQPFAVAAAHVFRISQFILHACLQAIAMRNCVPLFTLFSQLCPFVSKQGKSESFRLYDVDCRCFRDGTRSAVMNMIYNVSVAILEAVYRNEKMAALKLFKRGGISERLLDLMFSVSRHIFRPRLSTQRPSN